MDLLAKLLEIIEDGNAPDIGELSPNTRLVDDYYQRLVEVIRIEKEQSVCIYSGFPYIYCGEIGDF